MMKKAFFCPRDCARQSAWQTLFALAAISLVFYLFKKETLQWLDPIIFAMIGKSILTRGVWAQNLALTPLILITLVFCAALQRGGLGRLSVRRNALSRVLLYAPIFGAFILYCAICLNITLRRDDYWEIHDARALGFPLFIQGEYLNVTGRYTSLFFKSLYNFFPPEQYIRVSLIFAFVSLYFALYLITKACLAHLYQEKNPSRNGSLPFVLAGAMAFAFPLVSPNIWEVYFWGGGTFIYGFGISLTLCAMAFLIEGLNEGRVKMGWFILSLFATVAACGCAELCAMSLAVFSLSAFLYSRFVVSSGKWNRYILIFTLLTWVCVGVNFLSPGAHKVSAGYLEEGLSTSIFANIGEIFTLMGQAMLSAISKIAAYYYDYFEYFFAFSLIFFQFGFQMRARPNYGKKIIWVCCTLILAAILSLLINAAIGYMPSRVLTVPLSWCLCAHALLAFSLGGMVVKPTQPQLSLANSLVGVTLVFFLWLHFFQANINQALEIRAQWEKRDAILSIVPSGTELVETCYTDVLGAAGPDIFDDPNNEFNLIAAKYYGFGQIVAYAKCQ